MSEPKMELDGLIERFCRWHADGETGQFIHRRALDALLAYLGDRLLDDLTREDILGLRKILRRGTTTSVADRRLHSLGAFFQMAIEVGLATTNPVHEYFRDESAPRFRPGGQLGMSGVSSAVLDLAGEYVRQADAPGPRGGRALVLEKTLEFIGRRPLDGIDLVDVAAIAALEGIASENSAMALHMGWLEGFWDLAVERGLASGNPVRAYLEQGRQANRPRHPALEATQWELVRAPRGYTRQLRYLRDHLLVLLAVHTVASLIGLLALRFGDFHEDDGLLSVFVPPRGGASIWLQVPLEARDAYRRYRRACGPYVDADTDLFFAIPKGSRSADRASRLGLRAISPTAADAAIKAWGKKAGMEGLTFSQLAATRRAAHFRNDYTSFKGSRSRRPAR